MPIMRNPDLDRIIGQNIKAARRRADPQLSQGALGRALGCSFQQVQKYEAGKDRLSIAALVRIVEVTGQPLEFFFGGVIVGAPTADAPAEASA